MAQETRDLRGGGGYTDVLVTHPLLSPGQSFPMLSLRPHSHRLKVISLAHRRHPTGQGGRTFPWGLVAFALLGSWLARPVWGVDFTREIRPILSNHCWSCHGPDANGRQGGLRLDESAAARQTLETGHVAIAPGKVHESELVRRIESTDDAEIMPPPSTQKPLTPAQIELLKQWIASGAEYTAHWAFSPPRRPQLPAVVWHDWCRNEIDCFILQRLESEGLAPSPEADRATWLRRVTLDLTGVPPTLEELNAFQGDQGPDAWERVVDRLLSSPRHGERMAMQWLDAARFADTNGYNNDETRTMWPWRDWLIKAYSQGLPYDQFLTDQLAGDLFPNASLDQKVASGFNRNHVLTTEGGIIEEEYHVEYVADRVHTTATVFLGLSLQCARCHNHKYDPLTQRDFYRFAAFFDNVPDKIVAYGKERMAEPLVKVPTRDQQLELARLDATQSQLETQLAARVRQADAELNDWEQSLRATPKSIEPLPRPIVHFAFDEKTEARLTNLADPNRPATIHGTVARVAGRYDTALAFDGKTVVDGGDIGTLESDQGFTISLWCRMATLGTGTLVSKMDETQHYRGYDVMVEDGKVVCHLIHQWPDHAIKIATKSSLIANRWHHLAITYDGSRRASGVKVFLDGHDTDCTIANETPLDGTIATKSPFHLGQRQSTANFTGDLDDLLLFARPLSATEVTQVVQRPLWEKANVALQTPTQSRSAEQQEDIRNYYLAAVDDLSQQLKAELAQLARQREELDKAIPLTMSMGEMENRRTTYMLIRGQYDQRGETVEAGVPSALSRQPDALVKNRLDLARWLTEPDHPLTSRVAVNRWWEMLFGTGIVETAEDFGVQGSPPSHPELLDWLATELMAQDWNGKALLKMMVLSATYRQSSQVTAELLKRDPQNRWLARGPRYRLSAELVRDNALAISGLLSERLGGPSVKPYQPEGLWEDVSVERREKYAPELGANLYRRSMYTFWKRTCPPPTMSTFDAPDRETCVIRRARTNTPLQALILLNDPTFVEAARKLAERVLLESKTDGERLHLLYGLAVTRTPRPEEQAILNDKLVHARQWFAERPQEADALLSVGYAPRSAGIDSRELAAWTTLSSIVLNLDETITKR